MLKSLLAGALALALNPAQQDFGPTTPATNPYVAQVICENAHGTAFKIDTGQWVTVRHVSANGGCRINGKRVFVEHADEAGDFAIVDIGDRSPGGLHVDCSGFKDGAWYYGIGFGFNILQSKAVRYSSFWTAMAGGPFAILEANRFAPGQSGGPVLNRAGEVVGTVNAYGLSQRISFSRELKGTILCQHS